MVEVDDEVSAAIEEVDDCSEMADWLKNGASLGKLSSCQPCHLAVFPCSDSLQDSGTMSDRACRYKSKENR